MPIRSVDQESPPASKARRLAAIAFADIVGYSTLLAEDEDGTLDRWSALLNEVLRPKALGCHGTIVKLTGDGVLAEFPSALDAVEWGQQVQRSIEERGRLGEAEAPRLSVRIAVHIGDVISTDDDIYGDGINLAARLQEHAPPGGLVISEAVYDMVRGKLDQEARDLGLLRLKSFERPVRAYSLPTASAVTIPVGRFKDDPLPSIAVLPLMNLSGNPDDDYFAAGIVEDIVISLAGLHELLVIARGSTLNYGGGRQADPREAGRALGVRYIVMGSVRRSPRLIRVSVQLYDAYTGASLWGDTTEIAPEELFNVQDNIITKVVAGIAPHVRASELRVALRKRPESFTAYDYTLKALDVINSLDHRTFHTAREFLDAAMEADRNFAMPCAWAARWHNILIGQGWSSDRREDAAKAIELAERAIGLDRRNALALATCGHLKSFLFHDYDTALVYFDQALAACPNSSLAWIHSAATLAYVGRSEQAIRHAERGLRLSPFDQSLFYYYMVLGLAHYANNSFEAAVKWGKMSASENPNYTANLRVLAASLSALGELDEANRVADQLMRREPQFSVSEWGATLQPFRDEAIKQRYIDDLLKLRLAR
ncbi:MAG: adenylate/guanylate cyclase domain-containing protein [Hyphomicrobiales bacterium]